MLFPIGDDNRGRATVPLVNYTIIAINVFVYFLQIVWGDPFTAAYAAVPYEITTGRDIVHPVYIGDNLLPHAPGPAPLYLTILTSMFMHGGLLHLGGNMLYLWIFGDNVEDNFGHFPYLIFYVLCGVVAALAQIFIEPTSVIPIVGASGAISGVLGGYLILFPHNRVNAIAPLGFVLIPVQVPAVLILGFYIVIQFISQYAAFTNTAMDRGGVAYMAHIGGFIAGVALTFVLRRRRRETRWQEYDLFEDDEWPPR